MELAIVGLGRMGANMAKRLIRANHRCVVYDRARDRREELEKLGGSPVDHLDDLKDALPTPRVVWVMLPAGAATESTIQRLAEILEPGDIVIDGGNSFFKDDVRRSRELDQRGIRYLDVGVSGGVWGLERGYCMMIGGNRVAAQHLDPVFRALAPGQSGIESSANRPQLTTADFGYLYCGPSGAGHFVKMIHNGIEYGMMEAFAEGFDILRHADSDRLDPELRYKFDLKEISEVWRRGSVISSWLLDLVAIALNHDPDLADFEGLVQDSGEGRWTVQAAIDEGVPAPNITQSLFVRYRSREAESYAEKLLSAMRAGFGGHQEPKAKAS